MILILGQEKDDHVKHMKTYLRSKHKDVVVFDTSLYPSVIKLTYDPIKDLWSPLKDVESIYWRSIKPSLDDSYKLFQTFLQTFKTNWVNGWQGYALHQTKPITLQIVSKMGYAVPNTIYSNDPDMLKDYNNKVVKPLLGGSLTLPYTPNYPLRGPITVQDLIRGTNIRTFIIGSEVLSCEVRTKYLDFREDPNPEVLIHDLPLDMVKQSLNISKALHLKWASIDYRLTPEGRYVFLEANPSSMFIEFERRTKLPITELLGKLLYV